MNDPISDLLTRIRNAGLAHHASTRIPHSKIKERIVDILKEEGYIDDYGVEQSEGVRKDIVVHLRYTADNELVIHELARASKPGRRLYFGASDIPKVKSGLGVAIVSTSKGLVSDRDARRLNVGGEVLCTVW